MMKCEYCAKRGIATKGYIARIAALAAVLLCLLPTGCEARGTGSSAGSGIVSSSSPSPSMTAEKAGTAATGFYVEKNYPKALEYANLALTLDPRCYQALNIKGIALYFSANDAENGLYFINRSLAIKPDYQYAYFNKAMIYKGLHDDQTAVSLFQKSIALKPDDAWSYYGIATIYADQNKTGPSLDFLKKAILCDPAVKETAKQQSHFDRMRQNPDFIRLTSDP